MDHILCSRHFLPSISQCAVLEETPLNTSDHLPLSCRISATPLSSPPSATSPSVIPPRSNWKKASPWELEDLYAIPLDVSVSHLKLPSYDDLCSNPALIDTSLEAISSNMKLSASRNLPSRRFRKHRVPGWSGELKQSQQLSMHAFKAWKSAGKPRSPDNSLWTSYKLCKRQFRFSLRKHRKNLQEDFFSNLDLSNSDSQKLFRQIKHFYGSPPSHSTYLSFNNKSFEGPDILSGWAEYFEELSKPSPHCSYDQANFDAISCTFSQLLDCPPGPLFSFSRSDLDDAIKSLKTGKAMGPDGVESEHIIFSGPVVFDSLLSIFNAILSSCHIPCSFRLGYVIPIPKGKENDKSNPSNYRGISLLSNMAKLFEKLLLSKIKADLSPLNPLQGGFRAGYSCLHTAFILQESIQSIRESHEKAFVAFLDVRKAFDTVWHKGLFVKLHQKGINHRIWHILFNWYATSSCSVLLNGSVSSEFPILQGVRQGAILSPLLYSIFVDELLDHLQASSAGVSVNSINCAAPMFADDLALVAASGERLQTLLDICSSYASKWRYHFNSSKSGVMVFGESSRSRPALRNSRSWILGSSSISEVDNYHHLGILRSLSNSSRPKIAERCSAGRSAFFSLNSLGSRFGCLHPITSFRLYSSLSLPILIYGSELWNLSKSDLLLISRVHRKILRTIQGLPTRCSSNALTALIGSCDISHLIQIRQLSFINSLTNMSQSDLPRQVLLARLESPSLSGAIPQWEKLLVQFKLPDIPSLIARGGFNKLSWKRHCKKHAFISEHLSLRVSCEHLPISNFPLQLGKPCIIWQSSREHRSLMSAANLRVRLLTGCHGLELDAARFRIRRGTSIPGDSTCKLCFGAPEDVRHFLLVCPSLSDVRLDLIASAPVSIVSHISTFSSDPDVFVNSVLGVDWIDDSDTQLFFLRFINIMREARNSLLVPASFH